MLECAAWMPPVLQIIVGAEPLFAGLCMIDRCLAERQRVSYVLNALVALGAALLLLLLRALGH